MQLASHGVVLKVNDWLFAHGGVLPHHGQSSYFHVNVVLLIFACVFPLFGPILAFHYVHYFYTIQFMMVMRFYLFVLHLCSGLRIGEDESGGKLVDEDGEQ